MGISMPTDSKRKIAWIVGAIVPFVLGLVGFFVSWRLLPYPWGSSCGLTLITLLVVTMLTDGCWKKIPNWATYPAYFWFLIFNALGSVAARNSEIAVGLVKRGGWPTVGPEPLGAIGLGPSLLGATACFGVMVVLSGFLKSSGGDVKLLTVIGACVGVRYGLMALCLGYVLAGCYSLIVCIWHYGLFTIVKSVLRWLGSIFLPLVFPKPEVADDEFLTSGVPLGAHFAMGTFLALTPIIPGVHD
jgi:prepilin signal peptidase PulO-like enzyme (type II secretory pathway)